MEINESNIISYKNVCCIYSITSPSGKIYIGQTRNFYNRFYSHKTGNKRTKIAKAIGKYGFENMIFKIIENVYIEDLNKREQYWIDLYESCKLGYNINPIAGSNKNTTVSQRTKNKISKKLKGIKRDKKVYQKSAETKERLGLYNRISKKVQQVNPTTGEIVNTFRSINQAHKLTNIPRSTIQSVIGSNGNTVYRLAGGYLWKIIN